MPAYIKAAADTGMTLFATIRRDSDGNYWKDSTKTWTTPYSKTDHAITLTESSEDQAAGSYMSAELSTASAALDGGTTVRIHDDTVTDDVMVPGMMSDVYYRNGYEVVRGEVVEIVVGMAQYIADRILDRPRSNVDGTVEVGTLGALIAQMTSCQIVSDEMILYASDNTTEIGRLTLTRGSGAPVVGIEPS